MRAPTDRPGGPLTLEERKRLLVLVCEADRVSWRAACHRPPPSPVARIAGEALQYADLLGTLLPGRAGRLLRRATFFANVGRRLGLIRV